MLRGAMLSDPQVVQWTFSPLFYGIRDVTYHRRYGLDVGRTFSPLFYGIRDVTLPLGGSHYRPRPFSPLFYGIRDVT